MGAWELVVDVLRPVAVGLLLIALGWAASERGRAHQQLPQLPQVRRIAGLDSAHRADRFPALDRSLRRRT